MIVSPQQVRLLRGADEADAPVEWRHADGEWAVAVELSDDRRIDEHASDAFEALCRAREGLETDGWLIGLVGAQVDVWPSGMARDQGGGLTAYRHGPQGVIETVDTFTPADPTTAVTVAAQRAAAAQAGLV